MGSILSKNISLNAYVYGEITLTFALCRYDRLLKEVTIVLVGKYTKLEDAYASVIKALQHAALAASHRLDLKVSETFLS